MDLLLSVDWIAVQAIATALTGLVLLITLVAIGIQVRHAGKQVEQAEKLREDQVRPHVVADIEPSHVRPMVDFTIRNVGATAAYDVRLDVQPEPITTMDDDGYPLKDSLLMRQGIPTLAPGRRVSTLFDHMPDRVEAKLPMRFDVAVTYRDRRGREHTESSVIDLEVYSGLIYIDQKGMHDAAKALENVAKTLGKWTESQRGLRVFTQDYDRYAWRAGRLIRHPNLLVRAAHWLLGGRCRTGCLE